MEVVRGGSLGGLHTRDYYAIQKPVRRAADFSSPSGKRRSNLLSPHVVWVQKQLHTTLTSFCSCCVLMSRFRLRC